MPWLDEDGFCHEDDEWGIDEDGYAHSSCADDE